MKMLVNLAGLHPGFAISGVYGGDRASLIRVRDLYTLGPQLTMDRIGCDDRSRSASEAPVLASEAEAAGLEALAAIAFELKT